MNELVQRLCKGEHPIAAERSESATELKEQIDRGFVLLKFTETKGGTELGSQLDKESCKLEEADFEKSTGQVHLVGDLILNYDRVRLIADVDLKTLKGKGRLELVESEEEILAREASKGATSH
ncbi:hypothetical protein [Microbulbifer discodermiae]|uniref:hypothetical protein n=1 Tax=Microbulbifer sp. 2201CG32-9 TaxID=3232309 RepID=UPI00345BC635